MSFLSETVFNKKNTKLIFVPSFMLRNCWFNIIFSLIYIIQLHKTSVTRKCYTVSGIKELATFCFRPYSFPWLQKYFLLSYSQHFCDSLHQNLHYLMLYFRLNIIFTNTDLGRMYTHTKRRERDHWGDLDVDGWIILGWISRRWDVVIWTGLDWPRLATGGGRLWVW